MKLSESYFYTLREDAKDEDLTQLNNRIKDLEQQIVKIIELSDK